jgi:hypothetical protein
MRETDGRLYFSQRFIDKVSSRELDKTKFTESRDKTDLLEVVQKNKKLICLKSRVAALRDQKNLKKSKTIRAFIKEISKLKRLLQTEKSTILEGVKGDRIELFESR